MDLTLRSSCRDRDARRRVKPRNAGRYSCMHLTQKHPCRDNASQHLPGQREHCWISAESSLALQEQTAEKEDWRHSSFIA